MRLLYIHMTYKKQKKLKIYTHIVRTNYAKYIAIVLNWVYNITKKVKNY